MLGDVESLTDVERCWEMLRVESSLDIPPHSADSIHITQRRPCPLLLLRLLLFSLSLSFVVVGGLAIANVVVVVVVVAAVVAAVAVVDVVVADVENVERMSRDVNSCWWWWLLLSS